MTKERAERARKAERGEESGGWGGQKKDGGCTKLTPSGIF